MDRNEDESCCSHTDYETDGFWSSEKTLLESVRGTGNNTSTVRKRKKTKKKSERDRGNSRKDAKTGQETTKTGLRQQWRSFLRDHDDEWRKFWQMGKRCFFDVVRYNSYANKNFKQKLNV